MHPLQEMSLNERVCRPATSNTIGSGLMQGYQTLPYSRPKKTLLTKNNSQGNFYPQPRPSDIELLEDGMGSGLISSSNEFVGNHLQSTNESTLMDFSVSHPSALLSRELTNDFER